MNTSIATTTREQAKRIYEQWQQFARTGAVEDLLSLYTADATFESPLVPVLMKRESGVCKGREEMRAFFLEGVKRRPNELVRWYRDGTYFFDGVTLIWEYPRLLPDASEQIDILESMDLRGGLIARHRVYWGFKGVNQLLESARKHLLAEAADQIDG